MEIKIDTSKDSKEDIKKLIRMLQALVDEPITSNYSAPAAESPGIFNLFGNNTSETTTNSTNTFSPPNNDPPTIKDLLTSNDFREEDEDKDDDDRDQPKIEIVEY